MNKLIYISRLLLLVLVLSSIQSCVEEITLDPNQDFVKNIGISAKMIYNNYDEVIVEIKTIQNADEIQGYDGGINFKEVYIENSKNQLWPIERVDNGEYYSLKYVDDGIFDFSKELEYRLVCVFEDDTKIQSFFEPVGGSFLDYDINYDLSPELGNIYNVDATVDIQKTNLDGNYRIFPVETFRFTEETILPHNDTVCYFRNELFLDDMVLVGKNTPEKALVGLTPYSRYLHDLLRAEGYYLHIISEGLSDGAFEYWTKLKILLHRTGQMFDPAPGELPTNFYTEDNIDFVPTGYFYATVQNTEGRFFSVKDIQNSDTIREVCPKFDSGGVLLLACEKCETLGGASLEIPRYWPEEWRGVFPTPFKTKNDE